MEKINEALADFLKTHAENFILHRQKRVMEIEKIINPILTEVRNIDARFDFETLSPNSFYSFKSSSHYEILLIIQGIDPEEIAIEDGQTPPGFSLARLTGRKMVSRWKFCSGNSNPSKVYISAKIVKEKLYELVKRVVNNGSFLGEQEGNFCIQVDEKRDDDAIWLSVSGHDVESFTLDLIPAISCPERWVFSAHAWETRHPDWPSKKLKEEIVRGGIHLVARPPPSKSSYQWQIDFSGPMRKLIELDMGCRTRCLLVLEIILEDMQSGRRGCDPFHLKTVVIRVTEQFPVKSFWNDDKLAKRFMAVIKELQKCLLERNLGHVFLPNVNLLRDVDKLALESCKEGVDKVLQDPENFFKEFELFQYTTSL